MPELAKNPVDLSALAASNAGRGSRVSTMAAGLVGSEILKIAAEIRAMARSGAKICNLTVGDFDPKQFPIPDGLRKAIVDSLVAGETNYPPSDGVLELRQAVKRFYARRLGLEYPLESVLIAAGARPIIYGTYRTLIDPGDRVIYPLPSWNNNHYIHMTGAVGVPLACSAEHRFLPRRDDIVRELPGARLICLNTPLNPSGTAIEPAALRGICEAILEENQRRERQGARALFLMYDHIYWMLTVGGVSHVTPPELLPEMARYTIFVDGISKAFAATGVRVGWAVGPVDLIERMSAILGHIGAWAPRAEQVATVRWLEDDSGMDAYLDGYLAAIKARLDELHQGFEELRASGLPVECIPPMGAIYLTARIAPFGQSTPTGLRLSSNEDVRKYLLEAAQFGIVPFQAFGVPDDSGWFRLSVGAVSMAQIREGMQRLGAALRALR